MLFLFDFSLHWVRHRMSIRYRCRDIHSISHCYLDAAYIPRQWNRYKRCSTQHPAWYESPGFLGIWTQVFSVATQCCTTLLCSYPESECACVPLLWNSYTYYITIKKQSIVLLFRCFHCCYLDSGQELALGVHQVTYELAVNEKSLQCSFKVYVRCKCIIWWSVVNITEFFILLVSCHILTSVFALPWCL